MLFSDDEDDLKDPSKQGRKIAAIDQDHGISLVRHKQGFRGVLDMLWSLTLDLDDTKETYGVYQEECSERLKVKVKGYVLREKKGRRIISASLQAKEREKYTKAEQARMLTELINQRKRNIERVKLIEPVSELAARSLNRDAEEELVKKALERQTDGMNVKALQTKYLIINWEIYTEGTRKGGNRHLHAGREGVSIVKGNSYIDVGRKALGASQIMVEMSREMRTLFRKIFHEDLGNELLGGFSYSCFSHSSSLKTLSFNSSSSFPISIQSVEFDWGEKAEAAFQLLKQKLCSAPILALPEGIENFVVYCDALR
ncbi:hypothetical protein Tco_0183181 [Tanacetum coccineum]